MRRERPNWKRLAAVALLFVATTAGAQLRPFRDAKMQLWGYRRADRSVAIPPRYVGAGYFRNGRAPVQDSIGFAIIDRSGAILERILDDTVTATTESVPPPDGPCGSLECYVAQLQHGAPVIGGHVQRNPSVGEGFSSAAFWKLRYGVVVIEKQGYEGGSTRLLLPGVSTSNALRWQRIIRPREPKILKECAELLRSGSIHGGAFLEFSHGC